MTTSRTDGPLAYFKRLQQKQHDPGFVIEQHRIEEALGELGGGFGLTTPDPFSDLSFTMNEMYIGVTSPRAHETPHWHSDQVEIYYIAAGRAEMCVKYRWFDDSWMTLTALAGTLIVVRPQCCHWLQFVSDNGNGNGGLAWVFKAPQRAGVGRYPAGKTTCQHCPHFNRGCQMPRNSKGQTFIPSVAVNSQK